MARYNDSTCEPFRSWNRLEPRCRKEDFDRVLKAEIHDPLWLLTRQWQFGEFKGEDTGSAIFAKLEMDIVKLSKFKDRVSPAQAYSDSLPLETRIEREPIPFDFKTRVQIGRQWFKLLELQGEQFNQTSPGEPYVSHSYNNLFFENFPLTLPEILENETQEAVEKSKILSDPALHQFLSAVTGRGIDGVIFFQSITQPDSDVIGLPAFLNNSISPAHRNFILQAATAFAEWFRGLYSLPASAGDETWSEDHLEYQCACALTNKDGTNTVLTADEFYHSHLDWYAFDVDPKPDPGSGLTIPDTQVQVETRTITVIPTEARFGGMPNPRWWEFEDSYMDLGNIQADTTDVAKILLSEFALVFSNDWFVIPCDLPVGSLSQVKGIVVTDVFGQRTLVEPAGQGAEDAWSRWSMYNLTSKETLEDAVPAVDSRLFIPPAIGQKQESEAVEAVRLVRDETTNMVWAVETRVPNMLGTGRDGLDAARELKEYMQKLATASETNIPETENQALLKYTLSNTLPENWIPFIPIHKPGQNRSVVLQRGSMPRMFRETVMPVRPRNQLLRPGLRANNTQAEPYYIFEEEVPRAGVEIKSAFQRTRWYNGKLFTWYGRQKKTGRGEGSSGLRFDILTDIKHSREK